MSVEDNLRVGGMIHPVSCYAQDPERVLTFPRLSARLTSLAGNLSGDEQQMLAIGRALMARPKLIMIDELSLGLMPKVIDQCYQALKLLRREGMTVCCWRSRTPNARWLTAAHLGLH